MLKIKGENKTKFQEPMDTEPEPEYVYVEMPAYKVYVGTAYNKGECEKRKAILYTSVGKKCKFVDSHIHLNNLQEVRSGHNHKGGANAINYYYGLSTDLAKDLFSEDYRLIYCYVIHPKLVHTVTQKDNGL